MKKVFSFTQLYPASKSFTLPTSGKFVLTGGACNGKTSLLWALAREGFQTVPEIPTIVFAEEKKKGNITRGDSPEFQKMMMYKQLDYEAKLITGSAAVLDRSCVDMVAFCRLFGIQTPPELLENAKNHRYTSVFMLDFLPFFETESNSVRWTSFEDAKAAHKLLWEAYIEFGYSPIRVPAFSVHRRVKFVVHALRETSLKPASAPQPLAPLEQPALLASSRHSTKQETA